MSGILIAVFVAVVIAEAGYLIGYYSARRQCTDELAYQRREFGERLSRADDYIETLEQEAKRNHGPR